MKKGVLRLTVAAAAAVLTVIMLMTFMKTDSFANTYVLNGLLGEGVTTTVTLDTTTYDSNGVVYYGFKATKTGYITFTADYSGYTELCNSSKATISKGTDTNGDYLYGNSSTSYYKSVSYGVKKGKTYYIKMSGFPTNTNSAGKYVAVVKWSGKTIKAAKYGTTKAKAKSLKRKKTIKGLIPAGDKKARWYKITTKRSTINLLFKAPKTNDRIKITTYMRQYGHKGKWKSSTNYATRYGSYVKGPLFNPNHTKWTVRIKVQRDGKSSGYYTLKWK